MNYSDYFLHGATMMVNGIYTVLAWIDKSNLVIGAVNAFVVCLVTYCLPKKQLKQNERNLILSALAALRTQENSLLQFKDQYLLNNPIKKYLEKEIYAEFPDIKDISASIIYGIIKRDQFFFLNKSNKYFCDTIQDLNNSPISSNGDSSHYVDFMLKTTILKKLPTFLAENPINHPSAQFISNYNHGFLITFRKAFEKMVRLNEICQSWNLNVDKEYELDGLLFRQGHEPGRSRLILEKYIFMIFESGEASLNCNLEQGLFFCRLAIEHLLEYANAHFSSDYKKRVFSTEYPLAKRELLKSTYDDEVHKEAIKEMKLKKK